MRVVVDANILFAGLLRDSATRELLLHAPLELYAPAWLWEETTRNLPALAERSNIATAVLTALADRLLERIQAVPEAVLALHAREALRRCQASGAKDAPYVACCLAVDGALWSHDGRLSKEAGVATVSTAFLLERYG